MPKKMTKEDLKHEIRAVRRFLTDPHLVGWYWPWQHRNAIKFLKKHDAEWLERNLHRILPAEPIQEYEIERAKISIEPMTANPFGELLV